MSDLYSELLVKKEPTAKDSIVKYGMIVLPGLSVRSFHSQIWNDRTDSPGSGCRPFYQSDPSSHCSCVRCCIVFCDSADRSGV